MIESSVVVKICRKIYGFFSRQFTDSVILGAFLTPLSAEAAVAPRSVFYRLFYWIVGLFHRLFCFLRLDRLFANSIFQMPFVWCFLALVAAPILPTMLVLLLVLAGFGSLALQLILKKDGARLLYHPVNKFLYLYAGAYLFATLTSVTLRGSLYGGLLSICFMLFAIVVLNAVTSKKQLDVLLFCLVGAGVLVSLYGFYQFMFPAKYTGVWHDVDMFASIQFRVYSTLGNPNVLGEYLILIIPIAMACLFNYKHLLLRIYYLGSAGAMLLCLALTYSRGCYVAIMVAAAVFLVLLDRRFILLGIIGLCLLPFVLPQTILDRFLSIGNMEDSSTSYRVYIWLGSIAMLKDYWLSGIGPGTAAFNQVYPAYAFNSISAPHSHNLFLQILCDAGICGIITFLLTIFQFFQSTCSALTKEVSRETKIFTIAGISAIAGFLVQSMFDYTFYNYRVVLLFWAVFALGLVFARRDELE